MEAFIITMHLKKTQSTMLHTARNDVRIDVPNSWNVWPR